MGRPALLPALAASDHRRRRRLWQGAIKLGIEMRVGPVAIVDGTFGNRPHCIYRDICLPGCKVNTKGSPYVSHLPDAIEHGVEAPAGCMALRVEVKAASGRATGVHYVNEADGAHHLQRADAVAVAGYSIETPRLLLNSTSRRFPRRSPTRACRRCGRT